MQDIWIPWNAAIEKRKNAANVELNMNQSNVLLLAKCVINVKILAISEKIAAKANIDQNQNGKPNGTNQASCPNEKEQTCLKFKSMNIECFKLYLKYLNKYRSRKKINVNASWQN